MVSLFGSPIRHAFGHPLASFIPTRSPTISGGATVHVDIVSTQVFIEVRVHVGASASPTDVSKLTINVSGTSDETIGGSAGDLRADTFTGDYRIIASPGGWRIDRVNIDFERSSMDAADNFSERLFITLLPSSMPAITIGSGETVLHDIDLPMGKVTVNFAVLGGGTLSDPQLDIGCARLGEAGVVLARFAGFSGAVGQVDVLEGVASFLAPEGACFVTAQAIVDGTLTSFGQVTIDVIPGVDQNVDIGGPSLSVDFPAPGLVVTASTIVVDGTATGDAGITSVTVNGIEATLTSTGDPEQPNEVRFESPPIALHPGDNMIVSVATDASAGSAEDVRTVVLEVPDNTPPVAEAGEDIVQFCASAGGAPVILDASGSTDRDDDTLTFTWNGPFPENDGVVSGALVTVTLPLGTSQVTLTVDDGLEQSTDTVQVTIAAQVAGFLPPLGELVMVGAVPSMPRHAFKHGRTLPLRLQLSCGTQPLTDTHVGAPRITSIEPIGGTPVDLGVIDPDAGSANDNGLLFRYANPSWMHNLSTDDLSTGMIYEITIEMSDGHAYVGTFAIK